LRMICCGVCFRFFMVVLSSFPKIMGVWTRTAGGSVHGDPVKMSRRHTLSVDRSGRRGSSRLVFARIGSTDCEPSTRASQMRRGRVGALVVARRR